MALDFNLLSTTIPAEAASSAMKGMQQVNALTAGRLANQASDMEIKNALAEQEAYKSSSTPEEAQRNLMRGGFGKSAIAIGKNLADVAKTQMETKRTGAELTEKNMNIMRERTKDVIQNTSNENFVAHMQEGVRDGLVTPEQAQRSIQIYTAIPPNQRVAYLERGLAKQEDIYKNNTISKTDQAKINISQSHFEQNQNKPQFSIEAGGWVYPPSTSPTNVPAGGATNRPNAPADAAPTSALTSKFVPVEGITPKPTEDQAKTNSNINRIVIAAKSMSKVLKDNPKALAPTGTETLAQATPLWEGASAPLTNLTRSADRQIVSSGYADIIDALLYLSTGAAYNKEQLAAQREAFLPAWSDKEANKIEKVAKLQDLVRMAKTRTGKAWTPELEKATQQLLPSNLTSEAVPDTTKSGATKSNW